ncbi:MAG: His/Gly/Thr/Pro-type tRNA ligase C-terminal domain-containing protein [Desulfobacterales bacterium]|nr:His/Gly/Thr/Pro-type tRNA ligase C-terminal domain-containing protein [Desulfobacterales bacterium]
MKLGTKYSVALEALYLDREGQSRPIIMGSYGIGPARIAAAAVEQNNDKDGIIWPKSISPFDVEIIPLSVSDSRTMDVTASLQTSLSDRKLEVLVDDRDERPGVKFKDADLIGIPVHIIIGEKNLKDGNVEVKNRRTKEVRTGLRRQCCGGDDPDALRSSLDGRPRKEAIPARLWRSSTWAPIRSVCLSALSRKAGSGGWSWRGP